MSLLDAIKSLNPLKKLAPPPGAKLADALLRGQTLSEVMRLAAMDVAERAVPAALEAFVDGPAALLITCLLEQTSAAWLATARELKHSNQLPRDGASWVAARMTDYSRSLGGEVMSQHLINLVLGVTGLHAESLVLTAADVDARRLSEKLAELLKQGLSSGLSRAELAQTLKTRRQPVARLARV